MITPGIFRQKPRERIESAEQSTPKSTRWSIEHMAVLKPAHFDEKKLIEVEEDYDPHFEEKANAAIEHFWSKNAIYAPSPDNHSRKSNLPYTPKPMFVNFDEQDEMEEDHNERDIQTTTPSTAFNQMSPIVNCQIEFMSTDLEMEIEEVFGTNCEDLLFENNEVSLIFHML
jgi:hypothetical protein